MLNAPLHISRVQFLFFTMDFDSLPKYVSTLKFNKQNAHIMVTNYAKMATFLVISILPMDFLFQFATTYIF